MKREIRDRNKVIRERIKTLETKITGFRETNAQLVRQGQQMQQRVAQNNTEILKCQGGIEELKKQIS